MAFYINLIHRRKNMAELKIEKIQDKEKVEVL